MKTSQSVENKREAAAILDQIVNTWTHVEKGEDGGEYFSPANMAEIRKSRKLLVRYSKLMKHQSDDGLRARYDELFTVVQTTEMRLGNFKERLLRRIILSAVLALVLLCGLVFAPSPGKAPVFSWNASDWVLAQDTVLNAGDLGCTDSIYDKTSPQNKVLAGQAAVPLRQGESLTPLCADYNRRWVKVQTRAGLVGFVRPEVLAGGRRIEIVVDQATLYSEGPNKGATTLLKAGSKAQFLDTRKERNEAGTVLSAAYVRTEDGRSGYLAEYQFRYLICEGIPSRVGRYIYTTSAGNIADKLIGRRLDEISQHFGPADSYLPGADGSMQAYFEGLNVLEGAQVRRATLVRFGPDGRALSAQQIGGTVTPMFARVPLMERFVALEPQRLMHVSYYNAPASNAGFLDRMKDSMIEYHWSTKILYYVLVGVSFILVVVLLASIPRILVSPFLYLVANYRKLSNRWVLRLNACILAVAYYFFMLQVALISDSLLNGLIYTVPAFYVFYRRYAKYLEYKRCPHCGALESVIDAGTRYDHSVKVTVNDGHVDVFRERIGNVAVYDRYQKTRQETEIHYADQRICAVCKQNWEVDRVE